MAKLIYSAIMSLDGYIADENGNFDWAEPDEQVHAFVNDLERPIGTYLYGRRMYDVMVAWESIDDEQPFMKDYAEIWRAADKIVYSRSLEKVSSARTRLERTFDPDAVREMKDAAEHDISVGGPELAAQAIRAGVGGRDPSVRLAHRGGRRHEGASGQGPRGARAPGRTPIRQRRRVPPVRHQEVATSARGDVGAPVDVRPCRFREGGSMAAMAGTTSMYAGFWRRVAAALIDGLLLSVVTVPLTLAFGDGDTYADAARSSAASSIWVVINVAVLRAHGELHEAGDRREDGAGHHRDRPRRTPDRLRQGDRPTFREDSSRP